jgi:hypothetical protein
VNQYVVVVHDPARQMDYLTIGPFEGRDQAQAEARRWRQPEVRAMVRYLWDGDELRQDVDAASGGGGS